MSASPECLKSCGESHRLRTGSPEYLPTAPRVGFVFLHGTVSLSALPAGFQFGQLAVPLGALIAAAGVVSALFLSRGHGETARRLNPDKVWNLGILGILTAVLCRALCLSSSTGPILSSRAVDARRGERSITDGGDGRCGRRNRRVRCCMQDTSGCLSVTCWMRSRRRWL